MDAEDEHTAQVVVSWSKSAHMGAPVRTQIGAQ